MSLVWCLQAGGCKLKERVWATSPASLTEGPALPETHLQKHHRRRPEETDHHGQPGRDVTKGSGERTLGPKRSGFDEPSQARAQSSLTSLISRSLPDGPCSAPSPMSHCAAGAGTPASPTPRTRRRPPTSCSPARCPRADMPSPPAKTRARRVSLNCRVDAGGLKLHGCVSGVHFPGQSAMKALFFHLVVVYRSLFVCSLQLCCPLVPQGLCPPQSCPSQRLETKSPP